MVKNNSDKAGTQQTQSLISTLRRRWTCYRPNTHHPCCNACEDCIPRKAPLVGHYIWQWSGKQWEWLPLTRCQPHAYCDHSQEATSSKRGTMPNQELKCVSWCDAAALLARSVIERSLLIVACLQEEDKSSSASPSGTMDARHRRQYIEYVLTIRCAVSAANMTQLVPECAHQAWRRAIARAAAALSHSRRPFIPSFCHLPRAAG